MNKEVEKSLMNQSASKSITPIVDSIERQINIKTKEKGERPKFLFVGRLVAGAIVTELKKKNGGRAQGIDGRSLFGVSVHVMSNGKPDHVDLY